jgi:tetratricopeptide (TPR) repeat protein
VLAIPGSHSIRHAGSRAGVRPAECDLASWAIVSVRLRVLRVVVSPLRTLRQFPPVVSLSEVCRKSFLLVVASTVALGVAAGQTRSLGRVSFPTSGPPDAQASFLRGVALLHNFEYDDAIEAFREAQRLSPGFAMAYWGEAMCYSQPLWYNEDVPKARAALARLASTPSARAERAPTAREKAYLDAVERLFGDGDKAARDRAYADRMATLARDNPGDDEAALFFALALLATIPEGERNAEVSLKAGAIASGVLKKNPQHPGAAHYTLHAYDDGEHNRLGLDAARIYARIAPASSHALHMPSHVFLPLGMWDEAVASDEASFAASAAWVKRTGRTLAQQDFHSLSWLHYEYLQQGRFKKAIEVADNVKRALDATSSVGSSTTPGATHHGESEIGRGYSPVALRNELASMRARYVVESRNWAYMKGQTNFDNIDELFALGLSSTALGDTARADAALQHLRQASAAGDRDAREVASIMGDELQGVMQFARGNRDEALRTLARSAEAESRRPRPIARPYPIKPAGELYGEFLLASGNGRAAITQFQAALVRTPRRPASLLGLAAAAASVGSLTESATAASEFIKIWHRADPGRPELTDAQNLIKSASR